MELGLCLLGLLLLWAFTILPTFGAARARLAEKERQNEEDSEEAMESQTERLLET